MLPSVRKKRALFGKKKREETFALNTFGDHPNKGATAPRSLMATYLHGSSKHFIVYEKLPASA